MKLAQYLSDNDISTAAFAARIGVTQVSVSRYATGHRRPHPEILSRIVQETGGRVTANDFFDFQPTGRRRA